MRRMRKAFTLIELLIVIAIIAILALIAVPNFLEAQVRAKVTRVIADMRTAATALESYAVDWGSYPLTYPNVNRGTRGGFIQIMGLSTPVAYIGSCEIMDPFNFTRGENPAGSNRWTVTYINIRFYEIEYDRDDAGQANWGIYCYGPDRIKGPHPDDGGNWNTSWYGRIPPDPHEDDKYFVAWKYDATNGTMSAGDIHRWGG